MKYDLEDNINFFDELKNELLKSTDDEKNETTKFAY